MHPSVAQWDDVPDVGLVGPPDVVDQNMVNPNMVNPSMVEPDVVVAAQLIERLHHSADSQGCELLAYAAHRRRR